VLAPAAGQLANPAANPAAATPPASSARPTDAADGAPAARVEAVRRADSPRELAAARAETARVVTALIASARTKLAADDSVAVEQLARKALNADPQNLQASELLAHALVDQDRGREALPLARRLAQRNPQRLSYRLLLGDVLLMIGDDAGAKVEWQRALALAPEDAETKRRLGL
jgi:Flp pilus assembly protein TadD